jgi:hypothetical protein
MAGVKPRNSCRSQFKELEILAFLCEYIFTLMNFTVNNQEHFLTNCTIITVNTTNKNHFIGLVASLSCPQKSAYYAGVRIFNS